MLDDVPGARMASGRKHNIVGDTMHKARRARTVALVQAQDLARLRLRILVVCAGAVAALLALPSLY